VDDIVAHSCLRAKSCSKPCFRCGSLLVSANGSLLPGAEVAPDARAFTRARHHAPARGRSGFRRRGRRCLKRFGAHARGARPFPGNGPDCAAVRRLFPARRYPRNLRLRSFEGAPPGFSDITGNAVISRQISPAVSLAPRNYSFSTPKSCRPAASIKSSEPLIGALQPDAAIVRC
jgi:hypothetical protein